MGTFGKVFECLDRKHQEVVAVKAVRCIQKYVESARIEADVLFDIRDKQRSSGSNYCVKLYSSFKFGGILLSFCRPYTICELILLCILHNNKIPLP